MKWTQDFNLIADHLDAWRRGKGPWGKHAPLPALNGIA